MGSHIYIDISGQRFGNLTAISFVKKEGRKDFYWVCKCDCGKESVVIGTALRKGLTKSCGCKKGRHSHGMSKAWLYKRWTGIKNRCLNQKDKVYIQRIEVTL